ncbi:MAG: 50S ribosomal protein L4 [Deltaproteobacteria bacterium]|nr:50S ribosomal protein L4 [Deltaproteobacteria bacterium]
MAVLDVLNIKGEKVSEVELVDTIFNISVKASVLHEVVTMQLAKKRSGSASVKHRSDITGSGKKLFRQKGTGRARRGDIKSPLLRGGGSVFGPDPRSYAYKVPKKVRKLALKMALSSKLDLDEIVVLNEFELGRIKTKDVSETLKTLGLKSALIVTEKENEKLEISSRNIPGIKVLRSAGLNVYDILKYEKLILIEPSVKEIEGRLTV